MKKETLPVWLSLLAVLAWGCGGNSSSPTRISSIRTFKSGGNYPEGIGVDKSDNVWIVNRYSNTLVELSNAGAVVTTIPMGSRPHGLKIDRANTGNIWVENTAGGGPSAPASCPNGTTGTVTALSGSGTVIGTFCTDGDAPQHAQFDASGNIWVTNQGSNTVTELNGSTGAASNPIGVGKAPHAIATDQNGNFWIGNYYSGTVTVLDAAGALIGTIPENEVGLQPSGNDIDPSGNLWQSVQSLDLVATFGPPPNLSPIGTKDVGLDPRGVTIDADGNVFVANQQSNNVIEFNSSGIQVATFRVGACPENMSIDSHGDLWVTNACSSTVSEILHIAKPSSNSDDDSNG